MYMQVCPYAVRVVNGNSRLVTENGKYEIREHARTNRYRGCEKERCGGEKESERKIRNCVADFHRCFIHFSRGIGKRKWS